MRRRSRAGGEPVKTRRRKTATLKRRNAPKAVRRRSSSDVGQKTKVALTRELNEGREQQAATAEVLKVISRSTFDLQAVLETLVESAVRLCDADHAWLFRRDREFYRWAASYGFSKEAHERIKQHYLTLALSPGRGSLVGRAALDRQSVQIADVLADPEYTLHDVQKIGDYRTGLGIPLLRENTPIGVLVLTRSELKPFTDKQVELLTTFADQAVIAIENTRLLNELRESLQQQTATADVLKIISRSTFDLQAVFATLVESAAKLCRADKATILRLKDDQLQLVAAYGLSDEFAEYMRTRALPLDQSSVSSRTLLEGRPVQVPDVMSDPAYQFKEAARVGGYRTALGVPLMREDTPIGVVFLTRDRVEPFNQQQIDLITTFADQAVIAIENTRLFEAEQQRTRELTESLEQQTATSKVLEVISRSAFDLQAVFEAVVESSVRLCGSDRAIFYRFDGGLLRMAAGFNVSRELTEFVERTPIHPGRSSASARAALERRTVHVHDCMADPEYSWGGKYVDPVRTVLAVPILKGDELLGMIVVYHLEVRPFTEKQIALVETFADQSAIAIENARLLDELRQRTNELGRSVEELRALGEVSQAVNSTLDLETVLSTIVANAVQLSGTEAGAIYVFDEVQREFHLRATYGMDQELIDALSQQHIGLDERNVALVLAQREPIQVADLQQEPSADIINQITLRAGFRARLVAPLIRGEDVIGLLVVRRRTPGAFVQSTIDLIKTFAAQSAVAIENARLFHNVEASLQDLRTTQDRLVQTQKLASLGQLTAGIAHEIKNPLNFVNNFSGVSAELIDELGENLMRMKGDVLRTSLKRRLIQFFSGRDRYWRSVTVDLDRQCGGDRRLDRLRVRVQFRPRVPGVTPVAAVFQIDPDRHFERDGFTAKLCNTFCLLR
jgi:GAF domain-containing protein